MAMIPTTNLIYGSGLMPRAVDYHKSMPSGVGVRIICGKECYKISDRTHSINRKEF